MAVVDAPMLRLSRAGPFRTQQCEGPSELLGHTSAAVGVVLRPGRAYVEHGGCTCIGAGASFHAIGATV